MFEDIDIEINYTALALAILLSGVFIAIVWGLPTWKTYPMNQKIMITILLPVMSYFIVVWQMNR